MRLNGKVALVTGASRGLGRAISVRFALEGASVVLNFNQSRDEASKLAQEITKAGGESILAQADVSNAEAVREMVQQSLRKFNRIDILVNNAGVLSHEGFFESTERMWEKTMNVNLKGAYLCCKEIARGMLKQGSGKIINISTSAAVGGLSTSCQVDYVASKAGLLGITRCLAMKLAPTIQVNAICPGVVETDMIESHSPEWKSTMLQTTPLKRFGRPEDIANAAVFLASDESNFMTGEIITVAGGRGMR